MVAPATVQNLPNSAIFYRIKSISEKPHGIKSDGIMFSGQQFRELCKFHSDGKTYPKILDALSYRCQVSMRLHR